MTAKQLSSPPGDLIAGRQIPLSGEGLRSTNPADPSQVIWQGTPNAAHVDEAIAAARAVQPRWAALPVERREAMLRRFADICRARADDIAQLICAETGKAVWDSKAEAGLLAAKVDITLADSEGQNWGRARVAGFTTAIGPSREGRAWFRPHGVLAVLGPFNFPAHLPNGHIVPALLMGNTIVFKPSDKTPAVGQMLGELLQQALDEEGITRDIGGGVVNVVQGAAGPAKALVAHDGIDGILFTGSWPVGRSILEANLDRPGRIVALELGGNNPAVVLPDADLRQAAIECVRSAFVTTGQRCTCTRRLIVHEAVADRLLPTMIKAASTLLVGDPTSEPQPFMGPLVTEQARDAVHQFQASAARHGARVVLESTPLEGMVGHYATPGIIEVERFVASDDGSEPGADVEVFGPLLRYTIVKDLDDAMAQANATRFGLAASIFTRDESAIARFQAQARAGCININTGTAGASSKLPFGGLGHSGNHRPAGSYSLDYCAYPVAGLIESADAAQMLPGMLFKDEWLS